MTPSSSIDKSQRQALLWKHGLISTSILAFVLLTTWVADRNIPRGPDNMLEGAKASMNHKLLESEYAKKITADMKNLEYHRGYIDAHIGTPKTVHTRHQTITRDDTAIEKQYQDYIKSTNQEIHNVGLYGLAYLYSRLHDGKQGEPVIDLLKKIKDDQMPFVNNTIGYAYLNDMHESATSEPFFYKEISIKGNTKAAVRNLSQLFWETKDLKRLADLSADADLGKYVPLFYLRDMDLAQMNYGGYFMHLLKTEAENISFESMLPSLFIALVYLIYIYFVDAFEQRKTTLFLLVFVMGLASAFLVSLFYDLNAVYGQRAGQDIWSQFQFYTLRVGLFEETVKLLPVLIVAFIFKQWLEPVDILIFGSISGLGFACLENAGYLSHIAIGVLFGRALSAVALHICLTTLTAYGFFYARYNPSLMRYFSVFLCFAAAVLLHGTYDFCMIPQVAQGMGSMLILIFMLILYHNMIENGLNQSTQDQNPETLHLSLYLFYGLLGVLCLQFSILALQFDWSLAMRNMGYNLLQFFYIGILLIGRFGTLNINKGRWVPLINNKRE